MPSNQLIQILADGAAHHITELAHAVQRQPQNLNAIWQHTPPHIRGLLRQKDGTWRLVRPLALLSPQHEHDAFDVRVLPETSSTNDELMQQIRANSPIHRQVVVAHHQTAARGRQGRVWHNRLGECLTFSMGWTFTQPQSALGAMALVVAVACQRGLAKLGCVAQIKWSNDLVIGLEKLGGVLIETVRQKNQTHVIIGIGINFVLPKEVEGATSVQAACTHRVTAADALNAILDELHTSLPEFERHGFTPFQAAYQQLHRDHAQEVCILRDNQIVQTGVIVGISDNGALLLQTDDKIEQIVSGETSLRRPEQLPKPTPSPHFQAACTRYLLLDGGNSRLKWAWVEQGELVHSAHAPYRDLSRLQNEWARWGDKDVRVVGSAVCGLAKQAMVEAQLPVPIQWLGSMKRALGVYNHYQNPEQHGADRWFNALGSRRFTQNACVVMSCGTAVTVDALTADNHYLGGTIMPGFHLMKEAMAMKTANLNQPVGKLFPFPTTTANALAGGMMDAVCGSVMIMHARLKERENGGKVDVIMTGGGAAKVAKSLPETFVLDNCVKIVDNLVIFGLLNWLEQQPSAHTPSAPFQAA